MNRPPARHRLERTGTGRLPLLAAVLVVVVLLVALGVAGRRLFSPGRVAAATSPRPTPPATPTGAATTAPPSPSPSPTATGSVTIAAVGDTMLGDTPTLPPSPGTYLDGARADLRAQITFGNLEGTLTDATASKCGPPPASGPLDCYAFRAPPSYAKYLRAAGFTVLNNANNHSHDFGLQGLDDTLAALHRAGIAHEGLPGQIAVVRAGGLRVAFIGFAPYSTTASLLDFPAARHLIHRATRMADIVVVYMHAGAEGSAADHVTGREEYFVGEDRGNPEAFAHMAIDAGADLVIASGPHVLRGMQFYRGHLIAYSLGNFAGYQNFSTSGILDLSCVLHVRLASDGTFLSGRILSLRLIGSGEPEPDPTGAAAALIRTLSREDFGRSAARIGSDGTIRPPR